ncbi:hypothetical protein dsx2_0094 [Desulfovibrio sp. X2]|uniref:hypothetical protein n=1 Tax=Desulfovibrio sp. X2 TaxID=941449 RepID=UPI000358780F|nr:hypothetical protein [Desulfovibrio sp. X2]EPR43870.1 hypothetical protein dsx2_0094 [Desulfovibrio sp. X2]
MRLVTRADFDGLACGVLLREIGLTDNWLYVHPKDVQDGLVAGDPNDVVANLPYIPGCGYWFDHHSSEAERLPEGLSFRGASREAKSCARVVWEYFGGAARFGDRFDGMLRNVDKVDAGELSAEEIMRPEGWIMLGFIMDPRTGLGYHKEFAISNYQLMQALIEHCRTLSIEEILALPDVRERVERYRAMEGEFEEMIRQRSEVLDNVLLIDLRPQEPIHPGNRFAAYALFPQCDVSVQVMWGRQRRNTVISVGHSILRRTCGTDVGGLMLRFGGGGHRQVGTCQVGNAQADGVLGEIVAALRRAPVAPAT